MGDIADAAYIASRAETYETCRDLDARHVWDDGRARDGDNVEVIGEWLGGAIRRYDALVDHHSHLRGCEYSDVGRQGELVIKAEMTRKSRMLNTRSTKHTTETMQDDDDDDEDDEGDTNATVLC